MTRHSASSRLSRQSRKGALLLAVLCCAASTSVYGRFQTAITLATAASPTAGQAGVHNITVTGSNFPSGTIAPADVTVTLQPATSGAGPTASTAATAVTTVIGTSRRVAFTIPASIIVTTPTAYQVSVAGRTTTGVTFNTSNRANLTVNPPAKIIALAPPGGAPGASLSVAITTQYTNFVQGSTQANFGPGISVGGAAEGAFGPVTVQSPTSATAQIVIGQSAPTNARAVTVRTGVQTATLADGFAVATSNRAPTANAGGPYNGVAEQAIGFTGTATDPDNDALTFLWNFGDKTEPASGPSPTHTYAAPGDYIVSLTVADGRGGSVTVSTTVAVTARPNLAPAFTSTPLTTAKHQLPFTYQATATDPDGDALAFSVTNAPQGLAIGETSGLVEWTPTGQQLGLVPITLTVTDARGAKATQAFSVTVADVTPPIVTLSLPSESLPGKNVTADAQAIDNVGVVSVRFEVNGTDVSTVTALPYERAVIVPVNAIAGTEFHVRAIATDAAGNTGQTDGFFKVAAVPDTTAPTITLNAPPTTTAGSQIALVASPQDNVGVRSVTFRIGDTVIATDSDAPFEASYSVAADAAVGSSLAFTARATDFSDNIADASDSTQIVATPDTTPPTVQLTVDATVLEGDTLTFSAIATDNVGVAGVEFFVNGISAATSNVPPYSGSFALPTALVGGDIIHVEARARDFAGLSASDADESTVLAAPNRTPTAHAGGPYAAQVGAPIELSAALSSDPDQNDELVYHWNFGDDTTGSGLTPRHAFGAQGTFTATLTVDDGRGGLATATATIVVTAATDRNAPSITLTGPSSVLPASQVTMTAQAADDIGVVAVTFAVNGANPTETALQPYQRVVDVPGVAAPGDSLKVTATARDAAGNEASAEAVLTITGAPDTQGPTVSLIAPPQIGAGATLRLSATADDDVGVRSVTFIVNGSPLATLPAPPYEVSYPVAADAVAGSSIGIVVQASDYNGNRGDANGAVAVVATTETDTIPPTVTLTAPLQVFAGRTLPLTASVKDNVGVASVRFFVDNVNVATVNAPPFEFEVPLGPSQTPGSLLQLRAVAVDFSNLEGSAVAQTLVAATDSAGQGLVTGEVYDDAISLPLAGAVVTLTGNDSTGAPYTQSTTTDARGRWSLRATEGDGVVQITRAGWTRVDRPVTVVVDRAVEIFDARLTRVVDAAPALSAVLGGQITTPVGAGPPVQLSVPPGALPTATALALTPLSPQGLAGVLPVGWSPVAAADVTPHGIALAAPATLALPNALSVAAGSTLVLATWDSTAAAWRAHATANLSGGTVTAEITRTGQYAVLLADAAPLAPALPPIGELVTGVALSALDADVSAVVDPQPKVLFYSPGVRSEVHGRLSAVAPVSSGAPIEARISESYHFHNGTDASPEPFVEDLFFYQAGATAPGLAGALIVTPSQTFEALSLRQGVITVELLAPPPGVRFADAIGASGGAVSAPTGERLQIPQGALAAPVPVSVRALNAANLGLTLPSGLTLVGSALVNLNGALAKSATLSVPKPATVSDAGRVLLVRAQEIAGETRLLLVGRAVFLGSQVVSELTLNGVADAFEGVRTSGRYLFVSASTPIGFAQGRVTLGGGTAAAGALVSATTVPIVALSRSNGNYIEAAATGPVQLMALDLPSADKGAATGLLPSAGSVIALDLPIAAALPAVTAILPVDGAGNVALASPVVISFSRAIDPASVNGSNAGNVVLTDPAGTPVAAAISLANNQTILTLRPTSALQPNTVYTVRIGTGVTDFVGRHLPAAVTAQFTSLDTAPPPMPAAGSIAASIPNASGVTTITATQGTAGVHDSVTIVNLTRGSSAPALVNANGSFTATIAASITDKLQIAITDQNGNQTVMALPGFRQVNANGSISASVSAAGGVIEGPSGTAIEVQPNTFPGGAIVTLRAISEAEFPVTLGAQAQEMLSFSGAVEIDFGGNTPQHYVNVFVPAGPDDDADDQWVVSLVRDNAGVPILNVVDTAKLIGSRIRTASPPCPGVTARGVYGIHKVKQSVGINYGQMYSSGYGGLRVEAVMLGPTFPIPYMLLEPIAPAPICFPVLTGRVTISRNTQKLTIPAAELTPADREIVIKNTTAGVEAHFPRNVLEFTFDITGSPTDVYTAQIKDQVGVITPVSAIEVTAGSAGKVTVRLDPDHISTSIIEVIITNVTTNTVANFPMASVALSLPIAGGAQDSFEVKVYNASGQVRVINPGAIVSPTGTGNLVARAVAGSIDPTQAEIDAHNAIPGNKPIQGVGRKAVDLQNLKTGTLYPIDAATVIGGGFTFAFDGDLTHPYEIQVTYDDGRRQTQNIRTFSITVTNRTTGRVLRTIVAPSPPRDEPLNLGVISDDVVPPVLTSGPARMTSFDPSGHLTFTFSEAMDADSLKSGLRVELVKNGVRTLVAGTVRVSNGNMTATFVPDVALKVGEEYSVTFVGDDPLGASIGGGASPITDRSGNSVTTARFKILTFKPRLVGTFSDVTPAGSPVEIKDVEIRRKTVGGAQKTYLVGTADARTPSYRLAILDVTAPDAPVLVKTAFGGSGKKRLTLLTDLGTPTRPAMPIRVTSPPYEPKDCTGAPLSVVTGDLAVSTSFTSTSSYLSFFDVTDVNTPCLLANKLLTATPDTLNAANRVGTVHALGFAYNVATIQHAQGYAAYAAVGEVGIFAADIGQNIPEYFADQRRKEAMFAGDFRDITAFNDRLLAANRADARLDVFDPGLSLLSSVDVNLPPRRIVTTEGYGVDKNDDGVFSADEQFDLAFVATDNTATDQFAIVIVDITDLGDPKVIGTIPMPGITRDLAFDATKRRLFASGQSLPPPSAPPGIGVSEALFMLDLSDPFQSGLTDTDSDGYDDRVIWHNDSAPFINSVRLDQNRGLLYASTEKGLQIWAAYDVCCDLGVEMTAMPRRGQTGDRDAILAKEKAALQQEITAGLQDAEANCGLSIASIAILEQGSGACLWKNNPGQACSDSYQPGLSDHDYEVFFPASAGAALQSCTAKALSDRFTDPKTDEPKEITLPDGSVILFEDITFFPFSRPDFENGRLNVLPPQSAGGDPTGDLGLGRQQLLLLWLLGGEYIHLPALPALQPGRALTEILDTLKTTTGIPRLEGFEWAALQDHNFAKSNARLRIKGASSPDSSFYDFYIKQLHDAGKAGVRAAFGRLIAHERGNAIARDITRARYEMNACLAVNEGVTNPNRWAEKPCRSFEEYAASAVAKTLRGAAPLSIFSLAEVFQIHRFYRVKADVERIISESDAEAFVGGVAQFIAAARTMTEPVYQQFIGKDPDQTQRTQNRTTADTKRDTALKNATIAVRPHIFNRGFRGAEQVELAMFTTDADQTGTKKAARRVDLAGGEDRYFDYQRNVDGTLVLVDGKAVPIFSLGPIDLTTDIGTPHGVSFTIDLPEHKMKEANRLNNVGGFFYWALNTTSPAVPATPGAPYVPLPGSDLLDPSPECDDAPALRITQQIKTSSGQIVQGDVELSLGESVTLQLVVTNLSGTAQDDVMVCSNITNQCYSAGTLAVGQTKTIDVPYTVPATGQYLEGTPSTYSTDAGIIAGAPTRVISSCEPFRIVEPAHSPNPFGDDGSPTSTAMLGGKAFRYYKVIDRRTGSPKANASVTLAVTGPAGAPGTVTLTTDSHGFIHDPAHVPGPHTIPGVPLEATASMLPGLTYFAKFTSVDGVSPACSAPVEFNFDVADREFSRSYSRGASIQGTVGLVASIEASAEGGLELEKEEKFSTGVSVLNLTKTSQVSTELGLEFGFGVEGKVGVAKVEAGASVGASTTRTQGYASKYVFAYPLDPQKNCAIATLTLQAYLSVNPLFGKLLDLVRANPCGPTGNFLKSESATFSREAQAQAEIQLSAKRPMPKSIPTDKHMKVEFGASASSGFSLETNYKSIFANPGGFEESYKLKGGLSFTAGLTVQPTTPPKPPEQEEEEKTTIETVKRALKTSVSSDLAEGYSVTFIEDHSKPIPPDGYPNAVVITYSPPKGFGWKANVAGIPVNLVGGVGRTIAYTVDDEEGVKKVVDGLANLTAIRESNVGAAVLAQMVFAPTVLNDELAKFRDLLRQVDASYEISESQGGGDEKPLGLTGKLGPFKLGAGIALKAEHSVSYTVERGRVTNGVSYMLEQYARDKFIPSHDLGLFDAAATTWNALVGSFGSEFSDVNATVGTGGTTQLKSTFTATMNINGALEPAAFEAGVFSWRFREVAGPTDSLRYLPADTAGAVGKPHYGIGGFHQFAPAGYVLAAPTTLVIDYTDAEVAGIDESTLRIYAWNETTRDWDLIGGVADPATNTVTATVNTLRQYTLGPAMPARDIALTAVSAGVGLTERFTVTSSPLVTNTGQPVPDGTLYTVRAVSPTAGDLTPYGTILTADADAAAPEIQVAAQNGVIRFEIEYETPTGVLIPGRVVVYSVTGTAYGDTVVQH